MTTGPLNEKTGDYHSPVFFVDPVDLFFIMQEISFLIFPEYQQKFHMIIRGKATFVTFLYSKRDSHHFLIHLDYTTLNIVVNLP